MRSAILALSELLLLIRLFSCFVNVTIITKPPGFVIVITIDFRKKKNEMKLCTIYD